MVLSYPKNLVRNGANKAQPTGLRILVVRARPGDGTKGLLQAGSLVFPCALGSGGISSNKREGDGATPLASMRIRSGYFRNDHFAKARRTRLAMATIGPDLGWCEVPDDRNYNRPVTIPYGASHERMKRDEPALRRVPGARLEHRATPARARQRHLLPSGASGLYADARLRRRLRANHGAAVAAVVSSHGDEGGALGQDSASAGR